jgi:23S rRNA G2445 N2-methylase RlmL
MVDNACVTTFIGFEAIAAQEVQELIGAKGTLGKGIMTFTASDEELAKLCYFIQGSKHVLRLYGEFSFTDLDDWKKQASTLLEKIDLSAFASHTFKAVCSRTGKHTFKSSDVAAAYGELLLDVQQETKVDLDDPDLTVSCIIEDNHCLLGLDFAGVDLSRREYKIYGHSSTLNASFAYCAARYAGFTGKEALVDPMCGVGTIPLEAGLFAAKVSPRFYQKDIFSFHCFMDIDLGDFDEESEQKITIIGYDQQLRHITSANKMAKLANLNKVVSFSRADLEWLDTKLDEKAIDIVISQPPVAGRALTDKDMEKVYKEFYYQVSFVLAKKGKIVLLCQKTDVAKKMIDGFFIVDEHHAMQGQQKFTLLVLEKV